MPPARMHHKVPGVLFFLCLLLEVSPLNAGKPEAGQWLDLHNRYRAIHRAPPLRWSETLAKQARAFTATCPDSHSGLGYGENLAWATYTQQPVEVMERWYGEKGSYSYRRPGFSQNTGHFTQIVWQSTSELGCACHSACPGSWRSVCACLYNPPGNYRNRFEGNVLPAR